MNGLDAQIAEWRAYLSGAAVDDGDIEELEGHLRDQIAELNSAGLADDEAFLVAVKRMGDIDSLSREFAREHSGRLWKQLMLRGDDRPTGAVGDWLEALLFGMGAAIALQAARLIARFPDETPIWLGRNLGLLVLPFLAAYFARRRRLGSRQWGLMALPFVVAALLVNLYPFDPDSSTELLVALHLPVLLWFATAYPYVGGDLRSHERRMDFVRFTGEWVIYYTLIALGGGVLMGLTGVILDPIGGEDLVDEVLNWVLPSGAAGAVVVAAWLVESKQRVVENMAPVLTMLFTPLFAVMLSVAAVTYAASGVAGEFDRELLGVFDVLMVVVLGLVLYALSAREPTEPVGLMDRIELVAIGAALVLDGLVLGAMLARIGDLGFTPNRVAALGLNLVLLVNLFGAAWLSAQLLRARASRHRLERWQTSFLPVLAGWALVVVAVLPPLSGFE